MKWFYLISLLCVAALVASPLLFLHGAPKAEDEYAGQVVLWDSYSAEVKSIDPATCGDTTSSGIQGNVYEGLYGYHFLKRPPEVIPLLADGMPTVSPDGLTWTIRIKDGVMYHRNPCFGLDAQGRPRTRTVRAEDFVLAMKRCADYHINTGLAWAFLSERIAGIDAWREKSRGYKAGDFSRYDLPVDGLRALDERTLQIRLTERFPQFIYVLAMHVYAPVPREAVDYWLGTEDNGAGGRRAIPPEKRSAEFRAAEQVVGTGPYLLKTFERKKRIVLARNPDFRDDFYPSEGEGPSGDYAGDKAAGLLDDAGKKVPFIDVIHLDYVSEQYSAWMQFLSKRTDMSGIPREAFEQIITPGRDLTRSWRAKHIYLEKYASPAIYWVAFNMEDPVLGRSKSLRQAICLAYDVDSEIKVLHNGRGRRAVNIVPSTFKGHKEAGPGPYYRLDLAAAQKKLEDARRELAAAGALRDGEIPELKIDLPGREGYYVRMGELMQQQFAKLGLKVKVVLNDWPTLQEKVHNKAVQMYTMGWHADYPDAENFLQLFYSPNIAKGTNNVNYSDREFDRWYEQARVMDDTPERTALYVKMIHKISEDVPVLLLSEPESFLLAYDWVHNIKPHPVGYGFTKYRRIDAPLRARLGGR
ncbi:MAG TPA: ABC transporter substrate-binding protein [Phycisphaerae bacterium]|nr:ABC transporter substrate-binding protein [Phycisphaerae bacterium]